MKRILALLLALVMLLALTACGKDTESTPTGESTGATTTESTNDPTDGTQDSTQSTTESTTGGDTAAGSNVTSDENIEGSASVHTHNYAPATCTTPAVCSCGMTQGIVNGHSWKPATCTAPKTCSTCGTTEGVANGHSWMPATSTTSKTCSNCKEIDKQDEITKNWFLSQYNIARQQYIYVLNQSKQEKESSLSEAQTSAGALYTNYLQEVNRIKNKCANMGMSNSGYEKSLLKTEEDNYKQSASVYTKQCNQLRDEIASIDAEITSPNVDNILSNVAKNCNITSLEVYQYYSQYSNCIP